MKTHHRKPKRPKNPKHNQPGSKTRRSDSGDLNQVAQELIEAANRKLPDGVLPGDLKGLEGDVRQEAVLLALSWYLRGDDPTAPSNHDWHLPRAIAGAIRIAIRDHRKAIRKQKNVAQISAYNDKATPRHPSTLTAREWPYDVVQHLTASAIRIALSRRLISPLNAAISLTILVDGVEVAVLAQRRNMHPSNIYQHLTRARRHIVEIMETIEIPLTNLQ